ncbi:MAG: hypothetical protein D6820_15360, partial [Lentisphaerae bacterium]
MPSLQKRLDLALELAFTERYDSLRNEHPATRELALWRILLPKCFLSIQDGDLFAGRISHPLVGMGLERHYFGYYCNWVEIERLLADSSVCSESKRDLEYLKGIWQEETTEARILRLYPEDVQSLYRDQYSEDYNFIASCGPRLSGTFFDYDRLLRGGIPGLREEIRAASARAGEDPQREIMCRSMLEALDLLSDNCRYYADHARRLATACSGLRRKELLQIAKSLENVSELPPRTFHEAIQLMWLYVLPTGSINYGRMDVYLGDFLARDLADGVLSWDSARRLLVSFWRLLIAHGNRWNCRVVIGGLGRRNPDHADLFAKLAIEATREVHDIMPQLTLRFHSDQNPELYRCALDAIGEGCTFPMLYNDEVNVPAVASAFNVSREEAEQYMPLGCGEYVLDHMSLGSPNSAINLLKALEVTLHNGKDPLTGKPMGIASDLPLRAFDELWRAYTLQVEHHMEILGRQQKVEYDELGRHRALIYESILYDDCLARGRFLLDGGVRYLGGINETFGITNTADSLTAINRIVYEEKALSLAELIEVLDHDFHDHPEILRRLRDYPKYGNDDPEADEMVQRVHEHVCESARRQGGVNGLDTYLIVAINNSSNTLFGRFTG